MARLRLAIFWLEMWRVNPKPRRIYCVFYYTFWNKEEIFKLSVKQQSEFTQKLMRQSLNTKKKEWTAFRLLDISFWKPIDSFQLKIATEILKKWTKTKSKTQNLSICFTAVYYAGDFAETWGTMTYYSHPIETAISFKIFPDRYRALLPAARFELAIFWLGARRLIH